MENFRHSKEAAELQGFEKKFYDGMERLGMVVCEATKAKPKEMTFFYEGHDNTLTVIATIDIREIDLDEETMQRYVGTLGGHFSAFFTPAHYRPYKQIWGNWLERGKFRISGTYSEGV